MRWVLLEFEENSKAVPLTICSDKNDALETRIIGQAQGQVVAAAFILIYITHCPNSLILFQLPRKG